MIIPNNKQNTRLFEFAGTGRFAYNCALEEEKKNYETGRKLLSDNELRKRFTKLKQDEKYKWLYTISNNVCKQAIKDAVEAYKKFFKGLANFPKYKSRKHSKPSFYVDPIKIKFTHKHVKLENIAQSKKKNRQIANWFKLAEREKSKADNIGTGIDLGVKDLAVCSSGHVYKNINKTSRVRRLKKNLRRLQRKISRKYNNNEKGERYRKTRNITKSEKKLLKINHRLTNIRTNYIQQVTTEIIKREPSFIVLEDLNVRGMMKNKHLAQAIQEQKFAEFYRVLQYKCEWNGIKFITADRFYASSKICSKCGNKKNDLKLSDRTYICKNCGTVINRDFNAAINLYHYGKSIMNH